MTARPDEHNRYQREYYARPERVSSRMAPVDTPYVRRHLDRVLSALDDRVTTVVEVGAGMGRFSLPLAARGYDVTAVDLSPDLVARLERYREEAAAGSGGGLRAIEGDATELPHLLDGARFDAVVGFFFLHHLPDVAPMARAAAGVLRPGGRVAFCEPNAFHPGFYLQIALTPGMTWKGDRGIARMRPAVLRSAFEAAGFRDVRIERYGLFPPALHNRPWGAALERRLERLPPLAPVRAFQVVAGVLDG